MDSDRFGSIRIGRIGGRTGRNGWVGSWTPPRRNGRHAVRHGGASRNCDGWRRLRSPAAWTCRGLPRSVLLRPPRAPPTCLPSRRSRPKDATPVWGVAGEGTARGLAKRPLYSATSIGLCSGGWWVGVSDSAASERKTRGTARRRFAELRWVAPPALSGRVKLPKNSKVPALATSESTSHASSVPTLSTDVRSAVLGVVAGEGTARGRTGGPSRAATTADVRAEWKLSLPRGSKARSMNATPVWGVDGEVTARGLAGWRFSFASSRSTVPRPFGIHSRCR